MPNDFDKLVERVKAAGGGMRRFNGIKLQYPHDITTTAVEHIIIEPVSLFGELLGIDEAVIVPNHKSIRQLINLALDGLDADARARRCVEKVILLLHEVAEPIQIGGLLPPPYGRQVAQGAIDIIRREFGIEGGE